MLPDELQAGIRRIQADNTSGAVELVCRAADLLKTAGREPALMRELCLAVVSAQPVMAPMVNLANAVLIGLDRGEAPETVCDDFVARLDAAAEQINRRFIDLLEDGVTLLTHSSSKTVLGALRAASEVRTPLSVVCTESRPMCEGVAMARLLSEAGIKVTVVTDASAWRMIDRVELAISGADSITSGGLVNKTGTALVALAAREFGKPFYALCGSQKFLPAGYAPPMEPPHPASEVVEKDLPGVEVENYYFESVPLQLIDGVVTETGILKPLDVRAALGQDLHPALLSRKSSAASPPPCV